MQNGMMKFTNETHFGEYINYLYNNKIDLDQWETTKNFTSTRKVFRSNPANESMALPIDHTQFSTVLNANNMIIVGAWIFRLNPNNRTVYALNLSKIAKLNLLTSSETPADSDILNFSFDDDVLYLLSPTPTTPEAKWAKCAVTDNAAGTIDNWKVAEATINPSKTSKKEEIFKAHYKYNGLGILKTLYVHFIHAERSYTNSNGPLRPCLGKSCYQKG
jgi:hypothetical protein